MIEINLNDVHELKVYHKLLATPRKPLPTSRSSPRTQLHPYTQHPLSQDRRTGAVSDRLTEHPHADRR